MSSPPKVLTKAEADQLLRIVHQQGEARATKLFLVNRVTLLRAAARVPLLPSTLQCIVSRLRELSASPSEGAQ